MTVKVLELVGESKTSWQEAVETAVKDAHKTIRNITGVEVLNNTAINTMEKSLNTKQILPLPLKLMEQQKAKNGHYLVLVFVKVITMSKLTKEQQDYQNFVKQKRPKPTYIKNVIFAFLVGGTICVIGQLILNFFISQGMTPKQAGAPTSIVMIFLGAFLTGIGIYDKIGKYAGAGSIVPITGFANSIVSRQWNLSEKVTYLGCC